MAKTKKAPLKTPQTQEAQNEYNHDINTFILNIGNIINIVLAIDLSAMTVSGKVLKDDTNLTFIANIQEEA